jgi:CBS domain-containing protein
MELTAADLMTTRVITLTPEMTLKEMDAVLVKSGISGAPVTERGRLVGVASQADVVRTIWEGQRDATRVAAYHSGPLPIPIPALEEIVKDSQLIEEDALHRKIRDIMTTDPLTAHPDDLISEIADRMVRDQIHRLPVTDPGTGKLVGIITSLDLVRAITTHGLVSIL